VSDPALRTLADSSSAATPVHAVRRRTRNSLAHRQSCNSRQGAHVVRLATAKLEAPSIQAAHLHLRCRSRPRDGRHRGGVVATKAVPGHRRWGPVQPAHEPTEGAATRASEGEAQRDSPVVRSSTHGARGRPPPEGRPSPLRRRDGPRPARAVRPGPFLRRGASPSRRCRGPSCPASSSARRRPPRSEGERRAEGPLAGGWFRSRGHA